MKNILLESTKSKFKVLEHKPKNVLKRIQGVLSDFKSNRNGRIYPRELWENVLNSDYVKEMIESHGLVGELDHPEERLEISLQNVSHVINDMWIEGDQVIGTIDILPTPSGKIVSELLDYGTDIGISSRGAGSVGANNVVDPDYQFVTFDFVARPSCEAARLNMIVEGVQVEIDNNSDDKVNSILESYKTGLKEDNTTTSFIDIKEVIGYAEQYLTRLLNSSVGIVKRDDGQYTITMRNDDKTISKWLKLHDAYDLKEDAMMSEDELDDAISNGKSFDLDSFKKYKMENSDSVKRALKNYYHKNALPAPGEVEIAGYDLSEICDEIQKYRGLHNRREALDTIYEEDYTEADIRNIMEKARKRDMKITESDFETYTDYSGDKPVERQRHTQDYCNKAALDMCYDALFDKLGSDWRHKSLADIEDVVHHTVFKYNEANTEPEFEEEDFYGDEANANDVYQYILDNDIPEENKTTDTRLMNEGALMQKYNLDKGDDKFLYSMLSRLQSDCKYVLGAANGYTGHLWVKNDPKTHCALMREIYSSLPEEPDWISLEDIDNYEKQMLSNKPITEAAMSDQEVYKVVLGWYKQQIEAGKMSLNQCYELLSDKAKVSLNKMIDQSKIKESLINNTIKELINESIEMNNSTALNSEQYKNKVLEVITNLVDVIDLYEKIGTIEKSVKSKYHSKWKNEPLRSNMKGHYYYWITDELTREESKYFEKEKHDNALNQGESYTRKSSYDKVVSKFNTTFYKFIRNIDKFLNDLSKSGIDDKVYKSIERILKPKSYGFDGEDFKTQIDSIYKIDKLLKNNL